MEKDSPKIVGSSLPFAPRQLPIRVVMCGFQDRLLVQPAPAQGRREWLPGWLDSGPQPVQSGLGWIEWLILLSGKYQSDGRCLYPSQTTMQLPGRGGK